MGELKKIEEMTDLELIEEHRKMWNWLAEYYLDKSNEWTCISNAKRKYASMFFSSEDYNLLGKHSFCFACFFSYRLSMKNNGVRVTRSSRCENFCPFRWGDKDKNECGHYVDGSYPLYSLILDLTGKLSDDENRILSSHVCRKIARLELKWNFTDIQLPDGQYRVCEREKTLTKLRKNLSEPIFHIKINNTDLFKKLHKLGCERENVIYVENGFIRLCGATENAKSIRILK